ncbi:MAG: hypothetical protein WCH31_07095 [Actinomycetes bacterium]
MRDERSTARKILIPVLVTAAIVLGAGAVFKFSQSESLPTQVIYEGQSYVGGGAVSRVVLEAQAGPMHATNVMIAGKRVFIDIGRPPQYVALQLSTTSFQGYQLGMPTG